MTRRGPVRWTPEQRLKLDVLTTLTHESELNELALVLADAPASAASFLAELVEDGVVTLVRSSTGDVGDSRGALSTQQAVALLGSPSARSRGHVWIRTTAEGGALEREPARLFRYVLGDRSAVRCR